MLKQLFIRPLTVRVLPLTLAAALVMLTVKLGDVWTGIKTFDQQFIFAEKSAEAQAARPAAGVDAERQQTAARLLDELAKRTDLSPEARDALVRALAALGQPASAPPTTSDAARDQWWQQSLPADPTRFTQAQIDLLLKLKDRHDELRQRADELAKREELQRAAERRFAEQVASFEQMQAQLEALFARQQQQESQKLKELVDIYQVMKPTEAARIFNELQMDVLIGVASGMKANKLAPILAAMNPERSKRVTEILADRIAAEDGAQARRAAAPPATR